MSIKKVTAFMLIAVMVLCSAVPAFGAIDYSQWSSQSAYPADIVGTPLFTPVKVLIDKKIVTGDSDGLYHPEKSITRAEFATMMAKATNNTGNLAVVSKLDLFTDLDGYTWAKGYINACSSVGLIEGIGNSMFAPGKNVSYAEAITIIIRSKAGAASQVESMGTWPDNYIKYAQMYNMMGDVVVTDWNAAANKGDIAKMMYRNMPKDASASANVSIGVTTDGAIATFKATVSGSGTVNSYAWELDGTTLAGNSSTCTTTVGGINPHTVKLSVKTKETGKSETTTTVSKEFNM